MFEPHDIYSVTIVEDLLQGTNEWRSIEDILRLTLKALTDVVKTQGIALREVENQLSTRPTRNDVNDQLNCKAERREEYNSTTEQIGLFIFLLCCLGPVPTFIYEMCIFLFF